MSANQMSFGERLDMAERGLAALADEAGVDGFRVDYRIQDGLKDIWCLSIQMQDAQNGFRKMFPAHCVRDKTDFFEVLTSDFMGCKIRCTAWLDGPNTYSQCVSS